MAGITFSDGVVAVDGVSTSFPSLYTAALNAGSELVSKSGSIYVINADMVIKNNGSIKDTNKTISMLGKYFDIQKGSTFQLGTKYNNSSTGNGCIFDAPNLLNEYGFGGLDPNNSGNFLCYSSSVNAYCYWSFFQGDNLVDIINSNIDGYGKVSGSNSAIRSTTVKRAHGKYGVLMPATDIAAYTISVLDIDPITVATDLPDLANLFTLDGNTFADSTSIDIYYTDTTYAYSSLLSVLDSTVNKPIEFFGGNVSNGYNISRVNPNNNDFFHYLKFNPYVQNTDGVRLSGLPVVIKNSKGEIEYTGVTDESGSISTWLTRYRDLAGVQAGEYTTPHKVHITYNGEEIVSTINLETNLEKFPLILHPQLVLSSSNLESMVRDIVDGSTSIIKRDIQEMSANMNTILIAVSDKVKATEQTVTRGRMTITF